MLTAPKGKRVFAWGVVFEPDDNHFGAFLCNDPAFAVGKIVIDFLELKWTSEHEITLVVLDAKASHRVKTYHVGPDCLLCYCFGIFAYATT